MRIGVTLRNMGKQSTPQIMADCALAAEQAGMDSIWITDHIAIPPDDAEGSGGRYLDTLTGLAWLAGRTTSIKLGSGVLILPYRSMLPTAKQIATVQELSGGRLIVGAGVGWMDAEFRALGVDRHQRGAISDATLRFLNDCFADDQVSANGQPFLFRPRPAKPPILIGGAAPHALRRAAELADGWLPMARSPIALVEPIEQYRTMTDQLGRPRGQVVAMTRLPLDNPDQARALAGGYRALGIDALICSFSYDTAHEYQQQLESLQQVVQ